MSYDFPLISHAAPDAPVAYRGAVPVSARRFCADVAALAARLPAATHALNLCADRYRFAVSLGAALVRGQVTLLPPNHTPDTVRRMAEFAPGLYALRDEPSLEVALPCVDWTGAADAPGEGGDSDGDYAVPRIAADVLAAVVFTSGSTGTPQPHEKRWGALVRNVRGEAERLGVGPGWALLATVPPQHMYGFESSLMITMQSGAAFCAGRPFYPADVCDVFNALPRPRALVTTPFHLRTLLEAEPAPPAADFVLSATAPLPVRLAEAAEAAFAAPLFEIYGCTETGQLASRRTTAGPAWQALPGVRVRLDGDTAWAEGGHIDAPTALTDLIEPQDHTHFLLHGRAADMVNIAGKRTSLAYLNHQLTALPGVEDGAFVMPDEDDDAHHSAHHAHIARVAALVVAPGLTRAALMAELKQRLDPVFLPRPLIFVDALPRAATGKLPREALLAALREHQARAAQAGTEAT